MLEWRLLSIKKKQNPGSLSTWDDDCFGAKVVLIPQTLTQIDE